MGECLPSSTLAYTEPGGRSRLFAEMWDRDYPHGGEEPRINFTAIDNERRDHATTGMVYEQVERLHRSLGQWLEANALNRTEKP